jgi:hypothetical protein
MSESTKGRKMTRIIIIGVALVIFFFVLQMLLNTSSLDKDMVKVANEINKKCPMMVDSITRFDNAAALTNNVFKFNYTILTADKSDYDTAALQSAIKPAALNLLKTDPQYKIYRDKNTTLAFTYRDKNGSYLCTIRFTPGEYK